MILVVSMHAADTYSPLGSWYFTDRIPLSRAELIAFAAWQMYLQSFFMGLLFFIAGYFAVASLERKDPARFLQDRAFRLGLPVLLYMFAIGPVVEYFLAHSWNSTRPTTFPHEWIKHIRNGEFLQENGPLWFCLALLIFCAVYAAVGRSSNRRAARVPGNGALALFAAAMALSGFGLGLVLKPGFSFLNMHLGDFPQYVLLFAAGIYTARGGWLDRLPLAGGIRWMAVVLPAGFAAWFAILESAGAFDGHRRALNGWHWQSAALHFWESFTCVAVCYGLIVVFRDSFNRQGRIANFFSANAFSVYVFHPIFVVAAARAMHLWTGPPLAKFATLTAVAAALSFAASALVFRRVPILKRIL